MNTQVRFTDLGFFYFSLITDITLSGTSLNCKILQIAPVVTCVVSLGCDETSSHSLGN